MISGPFRKRARRGAGQARRATVKWIGRGILLAFGLWLGGFVHFILSLPDRPTAAATAIESGDGVVVLTGGGRRIAAALRLLDHGAGKRLLITGVNAITGRDSLRRAAGGRRDIFDCCVDIDRQALNTVGNARQTAAWARANGYRSLTVVTADYHMPRSLLEFERAMPGVDLIAYPVAPADASLGRWPHWAGLRLTAMEFNKYLISLLRMRAAGAKAREVPS